jgi:hypothetical protein
MSYAFVQDVAASWQQYDRYAAAISERPEGLVLHVAGPTDEGFRIIAVWESEADWERFRAEWPLEPPSGGPPAPPAAFRALQPLHVVHGRLAGGSAIIRRP